MISFFSFFSGHQPERFIDLQAHVTLRHMDKLTGYSVNNDCKVCKEKFTCYADLRDHVQGHGDAYRDPYGNPEAYKEYARKRRKVNGKMVPIPLAEQLQMERDKAKRLKMEQEQQQQQQQVSFKEN